MAATAFSAFNTVGFLNRAVQTDAVVIGLHYVESVEGGGYVPVVRFVDAQGVEHIARGGHGGWDFFIQPFIRNLPSVGDEMDIMYHTDNPEGEFWTTSNVWSNTYMLLAASVGFTALGLFIIKINADLESKSKMNQAFVATPKKRIEGDVSTCMGCNINSCVVSIFIDFFLRKKSKQL